MIKKAGNPATESIIAPITGNCVAANRLIMVNKTIKANVSGREPRRLIIKKSFYGTCRPTGQMLQKGRRAMLRARLIAVVRCF